MKITDTIHQHLQDAVEYYGNIHKLAKAVKLPTETVRRWVNRNVSSIEDSRWEILFPHIRQFFTDIEIELLLSKDAIESDEIATRFAYDSEHGKGSYKLKTELAIIDEKFAIAIETSDDNKLEGLKRQKAATSRSIDFLKTYQFEYNHWQKFLYTEHFGNYSRLSYERFSEWCEERMRFLNNVHIQAEKGMLTEDYYRNDYDNPQWLKDYLQQLLNQHGTLLATSIMISKRDLESLTHNLIITDNQLKKLSPLLLSCQYNNNDIFRHMSQQRSESELIFYTQSIIRRTFNTIDKWNAVSEIAYNNLPKELNSACLDEFAKLQKKSKAINEILQPANNETEIHTSKQHNSTPIISEQEISQWNSAIESLEDFVAHNKERKTISTPQAQMGDYIIKLFSNSMMPWYPSGSYLLVQTNEIPKNGNRVVAKLTSGEIVFKVFAKQGNKIALLSIGSKSEKKLEFSTSDNFAFWIWPIKWSLRNEDNLDNALRNHDISYPWESYFTQETPVE